MSLMKTNVQHIEHVKVSIELGQKNKTTIYAVVHPLLLQWQSWIFSDDMIQFERDVS